MSIDCILVNLYSETGSYFYLLETSRRPLYDARLLVPFMDTTDKCLMFFYEIFGDANGNLSVAIINVRTAAVVTVFGTTK